jgi:hypothetical protein
MKKLIFVCLLPVLTQAQNVVCFNIEANPNSSDPALSGFTKYVHVLDCFEIYAESTITDAKVLHAAAIAAELLDNNEDGLVDDVLLKNQLAAEFALMPLFSSEGSAAETQFNDNYMGNGVSAVLYNDEIDPSNPGHWGDDATVEEIMHTINHVGHTHIYPAAFSLAPNSSEMSNAMDLARGGQFLNIPNSYPEAAWYHYDDQTCDYECMAIEYMYWSLVSNMGILNDEQTCTGIANEWEACSPSLFQSMDTSMYQLIMNPMYKLPQAAPDGNYCPATSGMIHLTPKELILFPNPSNDYLELHTTSASSLFIYTVDYKLVNTIQLQSGVNTIETSQFENGIYYLKMNQLFSKLLIQH